MARTRDILRSRSAPADCWAAHFRAAHKTMARQLAVGRRAFAPLNLRFSGAARDAKW